MTVATQANATPSHASTFGNGVHPREAKELAEDAPIVVLEAPAEVRIPVLQHLGAACDIAVKPRTVVTVGEKIGDADAFISAPIHSSIAGTVARASVTTLPNGRHVSVIPIKAADEQPLVGTALFEDVLGGDWPLTEIDQFTPEEIVTAARDAGLVGLGGAAFPTHVKLRRNDAKPIDTLLINGCECEPYLTADYRLMVEAPAPIVAGALLAQQAIGADRVIIGVEDNKPRAVEALRTAAAKSAVDVRVVKTKYPQGGEKQLIHALLGRTVPTGSLPLDVGVVVVNVGTSAALARAVCRGKALTHRVVTVSGAGIRQPKNLLVPVGVSYQLLIDHCGGLTRDAGRVVAGGPMMGFTISQLETPVTKGTSGLTVLTHDEIRHAEETACVRCGRCVDVCPLNLVPTRIALAARAGNRSIAERYYASACMECGCCAYECPASIPLVQLIRVAKVMLRDGK
jgi:electron transport complex protein RnfC